jgi:hypothetical protein
MGCGQAFASDWTIVGGANLFYTNDVALFSASRRLSLRDDPTQPVVDVTGQGNEMVAEPLVEAVRSFSSRWAPTDISLKVRDTSSLVIHCLTTAQCASESEKNLTTARGCAYITSCFRTSF